MLKRLTSLRQQQSGFTLIELMVVVAIIALLTTIAVPWLSAAIRKAKGGVGTTELYTFTGGMERSSLDNDTGGYPADLATLKTKGYVRPTTNWKNRFGNAYILVSDGTVAVAASGTTPAVAAVDAAWYVVLDPGNVANGSTITVTCGSGTGAWSNTITINRTEFPRNIDQVATVLDPTDTPCSLSSSDTNWDPGTASVIRN